MSDAMELGAALAAKLKFGDGMQRARRALDVARIGLGGDLKNLRGRAAVGARRPTAILDEFTGLVGHFGGEPAVSLGKLEKASPPQSMPVAEKAGVIGQSSMPIRRGADLVGATGSATRAKLTMLNSPGNTVARPSAQSEPVPPASAAIVPHYVARARDAATVPAGWEGVSGWRAPPRSAATSATGRAAATTTLQTQPAYGDRAMGSGLVDRPVQRRSPVGENDGIATSSSAPVATSPAHRAAMTPPDEQGQQNSGDAWSGTQGAGSGASSSATSPGASQTANSGPTGGDVYLDGALMGRWMARNLANQASRPASGGAGFDPRRGVFPTGAMIGG